MKGYGGVVPGIVKSLDDPDGLGRIELIFPKTSESVRSGWARVAAALAGKDRGAFFMPEIDDEVLVAFEDGDFHCPYIVGFLWNGVDTTPETTHKNRVIKTPGGHQLRFEDTDGAKKVIVRSNDDHEIEIDDAAQTITIKTKSGALSVTLNDSAQSIKLQGGGRILEMSGGMVQVS